MEILLEIGATDPALYKLYEIEVENAGFYNPYVYKVTGTKQALQEFLEEQYLVGTNDQSIDYLGE